MERFENWIYGAFLALVALVVVALTFDCYASYVREKALYKDCLSDGKPAYYCYAITHKGRT